MSETAERREQRFTYQEYLTWPEEERWELIDGLAYNMTPAPTRLHQLISRQLLTLFNNYLEGKPCEVYHAPFDVRLPQPQESDNQTSTVVQPDILVVCDKAKLDDRGCKGSPDLIVEIVSPSTFQKDLKDKFNLYERAGVREYWIVYPDQKTISVFRLTPEGRYGRPEVYADTDSLTVGIFPDLTMDLHEVFVMEI
ncbi:MAG: Uma2 family endonuclease [Desulfitobacteriaceae bacterium]